MGMRRAGGTAWTEWLTAHAIVALDELDTRALVLKLREGGAMRAAAVSDESTLPVEAALEEVRAQPLMSQTDRAGCGRLDAHKHRGGRRLSPRLAPYSVGSQTRSRKLEERRQSAPSQAKNVGPR